MNVLKNLGLRAFARVIDNIALNQDKFFYSCELTSVPTFNQTITAAYI
jgi:hypothetical protein